MSRPAGSTILRGLVLAAGPLIAAGALAVTSCATEDEVLFGDPEDVVGATSAGVTSGGNCNPDPACEVSFRDDVFPLLSQTAGCGSTGCHANAVADFAFPSQAKTAREALLAYTFQGEFGYVAPCEPERSKLLCNLNLTGDAEGPFGSCGSPMPKAIDDAVDDKELTPADLKLVTTWIACGAPDN